MYKNFLFVAQAAMEQGLRLAAAKWGLSFLLGPVGMIISWLIAPVLAVMMVEGMLFVEFKRIELRVEADRKRYKKAVDALKDLEKLSVIPPEVRAAAIADIKKATKEFISIRKYIKS